MLTVLDGALGVTVGGREHLIGTGDTILFDAVVAHRYAHRLTGPTASS
ncbi:MAG TPA: cupin domain-containing protein [Euzebyales bacterium]|nr:cupin domain-containing protein [Euzebyales bacterium]